MTNPIQAQVSNQLWQQAQVFVQQGWAASVEEVVNESLRRYLESHHNALAEQFIQDDLNWGLHGND